MANDCIPFYDDGDNLTGYCESAVTGKTFVTLGNSRTSPAFDPNATSNPDDAGCIHIKPAASGDLVFGVASYDGPAGGFVNVVRGSKMVVPVTASEALTVGDLVAAGTDGQAAVIDEESAAGYVVADCASGDDAQVSLI